VKPSSLSYRGTSVGSSMVRPRCPCSGICRAAGLSSGASRHRASRPASSTSLPAIAPSPGFASSFANRLAQEIVDEGEERRFSPSLDALMVGSTLALPVGAAAVLALIMANMYGPWFGSEQSTGWPLRVPGVTTGVASTKKPPVDTKLAARPNEKAEKKMVASVPPTDVVDRPELFVDYAVIRDLDMLDSDKAG